MALTRAAAAAANKGEVPQPANPGLLRRLCWSILDDLMCRGRRALPFLIPVVLIILLIELIIPRIHLTHRADAVLMSHLLSPKNSPFSSFRKEEET